MVLMNNYIPKKIMEVITYPQNMVVNGILL